MKLFRRRRKNNKGFTLVEVICAVAIMGLATTAIGSAMIASTTNYQRGTTEVDLQKEAQTTTNLVGNLLVDAVEASKSADGKTITIKGEGKEYQLVYDDTNDKITYVEKNGASSISGCLAENVSAFNVDLTKFNSDKNAKVELSIEKNGKSYDATYNTTARNGSANVVGAAEVANIIIEQEVILEPNQTYDFPITVLGMSAEQAGITWTSITAGADSELGGTVFTSTPNHLGATIQVGAGAKGTLGFSVSSHDSAGNVLDTKLVTVKIRSVELIGFNVETNGTPCAQNTVYRVYANAIGNHFERAIGKSYDDSSVNAEYAYKNPKYIQFGYTMTDSSGNAMTVSDYVEEVGRAEDVDRPYVEIKLKQAMPAGSIITVIATSKHAAGNVGGIQYNKKNIAYDTVTNDYPIENTASVITRSSGLLRGNDYLGFQTTLNPENLKNTYDPDGGSIVWLFRYKEKDTTTWSQYYKTHETGSTIKLNAAETLLFDTDKAYDYQMMIAIIDWNTGELMWPHDENLLVTAGYGFKEYVHTDGTVGLKKGWTAENYNAASANPAAYSSEVFRLGEAITCFTGEGSTINSTTGKTGNLPMGYDENGKPLASYCAGSQANPIELTITGGYNDNFSVNVDFINLDKGQFDYAINVQKYDTSTSPASWQPVSASSFNAQVGGGNSATVKVENIKDDEVETGSYRIGIYMDDQPYGIVNESASSIKQLSIDTTTTHDWTMCGTTTVEEAGVNKTVDFGYIYFDVIN